jgi:hypothetical protein
MSDVARPKRLTRPTVLRLAAEACCDPDTVKRVLEGRGNNQSVASVVMAAKRLGVLLPSTVRDDEGPPPVRAT